MGFRDPVTTADAVDTNSRPTGPGVRVYQDNSGPFPRGVVEFRTGITGDSPALLELESFVSQQGDAITSVGNGYRLRGSKTLGVTPAQLVLGVEENPAGGYRSHATITADRIAIGPDSGGARDLPTLAGSRPGGRGMRYRVAGGVCYFSVGVVSGNTGQSVPWAGGQQVTTFPTGARPVDTTSVTGMYGTGAAVDVQIGPTGAVTVVQGSTGTNVGLTFSGSFPVA